MLSLFVDTNFLLQCRAPDELPWHDVTDETRVELLIARCVQTEIDRLKGDGNGRRARRARTFAGNLRKLVQAPAHQIVARLADPEVVWRLPPRLNPNRSIPASLDMTHADDQLVEAALAYREAYPGDDVRLLSNDSGPQLTAREHDLCCIGVPDSWLLEPELDAAGKAMNELARRVSTLERQNPVLTLECCGWSRNSGVLALTWRDYESPSPDEIENLARSYEAAHPIVTLRRRSIQDVGINVGLTDAQIQEYRRDYEKWRVRLREAITNLSTYFAAVDNSTLIEIRLRNTGAAPAVNLIVEIVADGVELDTPDISDNLAKGTLPSFSVPLPPKPPKNWFDSASHLFRPPPSYDFLGSSQIKQHSRHEFYWRPERPEMPTGSWRQESDEFRHQLDAHSFHARLRPIERLSRGRVVVRVSAANLVQPVVLEVPVSIQRVAVGFAEGVAAMRARLGENSEQ
jgi:hypothetical protein